MLLERAVAALESIALSLAVLTELTPPQAEDAAPIQDAAPAKPRGRPRKDPPRTTDAAPVAAAAQAAPVAAAAAAAAAAQAAPVAAAAQAAPVAAAVQAEPAPSYEPLRAAVLALANASSEGKAAAINVLSRFGVKKAAEIPVERWDEAQAAFEAELAILNGDADDFA